MRGARLTDRAGDVPRAVRRHGLQPEWLLRDLLVRSRDEQVRAEARVVSLTGAAQASQPASTSSCTPAPSARHVCEISNAVDVGTGSLERSSAQRDDTCST
jgi:hypothetical protein